MWSSIKPEIPQFVYIGRAVSSFQSAYLHNVMLGYGYAQLFLGFCVTSTDPDLRAPFRVHTPAQGVITLESIYFC